jgi:ABC-2 type transport system permease protein
VPTDLLQLFVLLVVWTVVAWRAVKGRGGLEQLRARQATLSGPRRALSKAIALPVLLAGAAARRARGGRQATMNASRQPRSLGPAFGKAAVAQKAHLRGSRVGGSRAGRPANGAARLALLIAAKDLRQRVLDRSAVLVSVGAPLLLAIIFSQLLGGVAEFHPTYAVADLDGGGSAASLRQGVIGSFARGGGATIINVPTAAAARSDVDDGTADAAFIIPAGFSSAVASGSPARLELVGARGSEVSVAIAEALAREFGNKVVTVELSAATITSLSGEPPGPATRAAIAAAADRPAITLADTPTPLRQLTVTTYLAAGMAILFLFLSAQIAVVSLFEERRIGTLGRILAAPVRPSTVLLGKAIGGFTLGVASMTVLVAATTAVIHADWGPIPGVAALTVAAIVAALGVSTLVVSFARSPESAAATGSAVAMTLGIVGGAFTPGAQASPLLSTLALVTPHAWFLRGLASLHGTGASVVDCLPAAGVLLAMGVLAGVLGLGRVRHLVAAA